MIVELKVKPRLKCELQNKGRLVFFFSPSAALHRASSAKIAEEIEKYTNSFMMTGRVDCMRQDVERDTILNRMLSAFLPPKTPFFCLVVKIKYKSHSLVLPAKIISKHIDEGH